MGREFDRDRVEKLRWGRGAILDGRVAESAWEHVPERVRQGDHDRPRIARLTILGTIPVTPSFWLSSAAPPTADDAPIVAFSERHQRWH